MSVGGSRTSLWRQYVATPQSLFMHPQLQFIFDYFPNDDIIIVGSAVSGFANARDIDVQFLNSDQYLAACKRYDLKYNGWDTPRGHVRRANMRLRGVFLPVQLIHVDTTTTADDHPHIVLQRGGTVLHEDKHYNKP